MPKLKLHWQILIALVLSVPLGLYFPEGALKIEWMGDVFLSALKMIIIPLVLTSIIGGISNINPKELGRVGLKTMLYYLGTTTFAILVGLILVNIFKPGVGVELSNTTDMSQLANAAGSFGNTLKNIIPNNIFKAFVQADMLSIIFFAVLFGVFLSQVEEVYKTAILNVNNGIFEVMIKIVNFVLKFTPLGIFGLVSAEIASQQDIMSLAAGLGTYFIIVVAGLLTHSFVVIPLILKYVGKTSFMKHFQAMATPLLTAFSTSSSGATLPLTMDTIEHKTGVSNRITSFTLPLGATVNMDGTALYECVAAMFIAQVYGIELTVMQQVIVVITALLASIGAAAIPMAGLVMISVVLSAIGLPLEAVGLIIAVDRPLDMLRTSVNVWSDSCGAIVIAKSEGETLNY
ncbi:MAG: dicarboxylate/amino acid:cation symporter [Bacteroidales bacterium]|jgi:proton glutamate symport protein|nr:dicarboxylate/amino acid:cation symporter [Bacteroidales bacterium]